MLYPDQYEAFNLTLMIWCLCLGLTLKNTDTWWISFFKSTGLSLSSCSPDKQRLPGEHRPKRLAEKNTINIGSADRNIQWWVFLCMKQAGDSSDRV